MPHERQRRPANNLVREGDMPGLPCSQGAVSLLGARFEQRQADLGVSQRCGSLQYCMFSVYAVGIGPLLQGHTTPVEAPSTDAHHKLLVVCAHALHS